MNRFFVNKEQVLDNNIDIINEDVRHIKNVLRLEEDDEIEIVADGIVYRTKIVEIDSKRISTEIISNHKGKNESNLDIFLYQGIAKGSNMDLIIQKATEIGVKKIFPIETNRTVVKLKGDKKIKSRLARWNQISLEASKQSKRDIIPKVENIMDFDELLKYLEGQENILIPYELEENKSTKEALENINIKKPIHIIIGPEGGFEIEEVEGILNIKGQSISLGPRILRTETAGIVASSIVLYELGDLGVRE